MEMKTIHGRMLLIVTVWTRLHLLLAQPVWVGEPLWSGCGETEYINGSDFQRNVIQVLESLSGNASTSGFNTSSVEGQNSNSAVYGFIQCRGDLNSSDCKGFASTAKESLVKKCHNTSGFYYIDAYFLRYDNHSFWNDYDESSANHSICNNNIASAQPDLFANITLEALSNLINKTVRSHTLFATEKFETNDESFPEIYSLAQCWNHVSPTNCQTCLAAGRSILSDPAEGCKTGCLGARYLSMYCMLVYQVYNFFNTSIMPSPPPPKESPPVSGEGREIDLSPSIAHPELIFNYDILEKAASNFNEEDKLGEGGFGSVYKGVLPDAREVAIKRLNLNSRQGDTEFLNEANLISRVQHRNLVKLLGCSVKSSERLLVYEYLENGSLDNILFDRTKRHLLDWNDRYEIIVGTARGLAYLHEESDIRIIHRDIKASNILLDKKYKPKIADFGLAKLFGEDQSHVSTRIAGTFGYMAPEYALSGQLTEKADVFSFGVLVLEIISGRKNQSLPQQMVFLQGETWRLYKEERALEVMDPTLEGRYSCEEAMRVIKIGLLCTQGAATLRPSMSLVVSMLTSEREHLSSPTRPVYIDVENLTESHQLQRSTVVDSDKASSSTTISSDTHSDIHSATAAPAAFDPDRASRGTAISSNTHYDIHSATAHPSSGAYVKISQRLGAYYCCDP